MKLVKLLMLSAVLFLAPVTASAGLIGDVVCGLLVPCDEETTPAVPEPSGALVMGLALLTVGVASRKLRK